MLCFPGAPDTKNRCDIGRCRYLSGNIVYGTTRYNGNVGMVALGHICRNHRIGHYRLKITPTDTKSQSEKDHVNFL